MDKVFPRFAETPEELSVHLQQMVIWLENAAAHDIPQYQNLDYKYQVTNV